jgi:hypothetical protein
VAYKLKLPKRLVDVHDIFHVSQLKKCLRVSEGQVVTNTLDLQDDLRYQEVPIKILETMTKRTRQKPSIFARYNGVSPISWSDLGKRRCSERRIPTAV